MKGRMTAAAVLACALVGTAGTAAYADGENVERPLPTRRPGAE